MPLSITDNRPVHYQGDASLQTLESIMNNSAHNPASPFCAWSRTNAAISITKGAHNGAYYQEGSYYFDIKVDGGTELHCLIGYPANSNHEILAIR